MGAEREMILLLEMLQEMLLHLKSGNKHNESLPSYIYFLIICKSHRSITFNRLSSSETIDTC